MSQQDFIEWCCDIMFYVLTQSAREMRLLVAIEGFYVVTVLARPRVFYRDRVWPNRDVLCCGREILYCNIVGQAGNISCGN